ncbi:MAG: hypothetical protein V4736_15615 [Bdellovibrionota bacterium]
MRRNWAFLILIFSISLSSHALAEGPAAPAAAKKPSKNIYERENDSKSFTAKVRVIREIQGETEVFFESSTASGTYYLPAAAKDYGLMKNRLRKSLAPQGPKVQVTADESDKINSVEIEEAPAKTTPAPEEF